MLLGDRKCWFVKLMTSDTIKQYGIVHVDFDGYG